MKIILSLLFIGLTVFNYSCRYQKPGIDGYWQATFSDPVENPEQYLEIRNSHNRLTINIDEPAEDWYNIPGEKSSFHNDSLHFERFWGLEKYDGIVLPGDSQIMGIKLIKNRQPVSYIIRKTNRKSVFKVPRSGPDGEQILKYKYTKPVEHHDQFMCATLEDVGIDSVKIYELIGKILSGQIPNIHSLLILKDDKLVLEEYFYGYSAGRSHRVHSVTKSIASALIGIALDKKLIQSVNEPVWKYFTDWNKTKWIEEKYDIKIEHLLSMSAGLDWKGLTLNESNDDMDMYAADDYYEYVLNKNQRFNPGSNFCYNNGLSLMLGHILEKASGIAIDSFARKNLFNYLIITSYSFDVDQNGVTRLDGGLKMRPRDMLSFGFLYLNNGEWNGEQILKENWIKNSTSQKMNLNDRGYAYHWWTMDYIVNGKVCKTYYALGHGEQAIIVVPDAKLVFVMTAGNYMQVEKRPFEIMSQYILPSLKPGNNKDNVCLSAFQGEYQINQTESITVVVVDNNLVAADPAGVKLRLIRKSDFTFMTEDKSREIHFITDNKGEICYAEIFADGQKKETLKKK